MFGLGIGELIVILVILLLMFGSKKLPQLGESMGKAINSFKKGLKEGSEEAKIDHQDDKK
jgi:sec-independent protein translocase protein TatA